MRKTKHVKIIMLLCVVGMIFTGCDKEIGPESSTVPMPGTNSSSSEEAETTPEPIPSETETDDSPKETVDDSLKDSSDNTSPSESDKSDDNEETEDKKGDLNIKVSGMEVYINEIKVEYSLTTLKNFIETDLRENGSIYLDDAEGDYKLSEAIRADIDSLKYNAIIVND